MNSPRNLVKCTKRISRPFCYARARSRKTLDDNSSSTNGNLTMSNMFIFAILPHWHIYLSFLLGGIWHFLFWSFITLVFDVLDTCNAMVSLMLEYDGSNRPISMANRRTPFGSFSCMDGEYISKSTSTCYVSSIAVFFRRIFLVSCTNSIFWS